MIIYFIKFGQKLLIENKFRKNLIYAIEGIVPLVIGILIAFYENIIRKYDVADKLETITTHSFL